MTIASAPGAAPRRGLAWVALLTALVDLGVLALLHLLQPDVDPLRTATSEYVHGTGGVLAPVATAAAGLGALSLAAALAPLVRGGRARGRAGLALLVVFGAVKLAQAFFPIDPAGAEPTTSGNLHNVLGNLAFFTLPVAAGLLGAVLALATGRRVVAVLAWVVVATTVAVVAGDAAGVFGLAQRVYLISAALWVGVSAWALLNVRAQIEVTHSP